MSVAEVHSNERSSFGLLMDESHRDLLRRNLVALTTDLDPGDVYILLIQNGVLTEDEKETLSNRRMNTCRRDGAHDLIKVLQRKGPTAFEAFMDALWNTYPHLYGRISGGRTDIIPKQNVDTETKLLQSSSLKEHPEVGTPVPGKQTLADVVPSTELDLGTSQEQIR
ncbi:hypothetical protein CAPTEDRAFT_213419 [Capitella teleta]|uniref:CARD domain-containing protein n=1 Tax=Capitella teleta TaxID=283909 RepID=R7VIL1_CAPTE|nr:hypothetical protein CAPTEDRAFT_213419 [Capitella teleta]|eukprot:ELU18464.1 hypothetical protein CAPTEDRAFT_213419 [Capitella teleta]